MKLPVIQGVIRRRLLVNFRVDPEVMRRVLPSPFEAKLHRDSAIAGICLIRLETIRPKGLPRFCGISSENAAHRVAVTWKTAEGATQEGVYIPRRDTNSWLNAMAGGRLFPGEHHRARFEVADDGRQVSISIRSPNGEDAVQVKGAEHDVLPADSCFRSLAESSAFFEAGSVGYSATRDCCHFQGISLETVGWQVRPFQLDNYRSSYFADPALFPAGSVAFDHALIMRDVEHEWRGMEDLRTGLS